MRFAPVTARGPRRRVRSLPGVDTTPQIFAANPNASRISGEITITLTGTNFRYSTNGDAPIVLFGETPATDVVVISASQLTCRCPEVTAEEVGLTDVTVICDSQIGIADGIFTYYSAVIKEVVPNHGFFGGGTPVVVHGFNFLPGCTIAFGGNAATDVQFIDRQHYACVTPPHARGWVDVVMTEPEYNLGEELMDIDFGGSWTDASPVATDPETVDAVEYRDRRIPWASLPDGTVVTWRAYGKVPSGASMTLQLYDVDNALVAFTDPTPFTGTSFALHTIVLTSPLVDRNYRLQAVVTGAAGQQVNFLAIARTVLP